MGSSALVGSSMSSTSGSTASARAMHSRCCWPPERPKGRRFDVELPGDGVYEVGIKRWNADKTLLLERQVYWLLLLDGNEYTIPKWQVLPLVEALRSGTLGA